MDFGASVLTENTSIQYAVTWYVYLHIYSMWNLGSLQLDSESEPLRQTVKIGGISELITVHAVTCHLSTQPSSGIFLSEVRLTCRGSLTGLWVDDCYIMIQQLPPIVPSLPYPTWESTSRARLLRRARSFKTTSCGDSARAASLAQPDTLPLIRPVRW